MISWINKNGARRARARKLPFRIDPRDVEKAESRRRRRRDATDAGVATPPTPPRPLVRNRRLASQLVTERDKTKTTRLKMSAKKAKKY